MHTWKVFVASAILIATAGLAFAPSPESTPLAVSYSHAGSAGEVDADQQEVPFAWNAALTEAQSGVTVTTESNEVVASLTDAYSNAYFELEWKCIGFCDLEGRIMDPYGVEQRTFTADYSNQPWSVYVEQPVSGDWTVELWPSMGGASYDGVVRVTAVQADA